MQDSSQGIVTLLDPGGLQRVGARGKGVWPPGGQQREGLEISSGGRDMQPRGSGVCMTAVVPVVIPAGGDREG